MSAQQNITEDKQAGDKDEAGKKQQSFGNKAFSILAWSLVQWIGVWLFSLVLANKIINGKGAPNRWYKQTKEWLTPRMEGFANNKVIKKMTGSTKEEWANSVVLISALSVGGYISLPFIKFFEDRRAKISGWIDNKFGKTPVDPANIQEQPKQTWGSIIKGRLTALAVDYTAFVFVGPARMNKVQDAVGGGATNLYMKFAKNADKTKVRKWADLAVFDLFFTAVATGFHFLMSRVYAKEKDFKKAYEIVEAEKAEKKIEKAEEKQEEKSDAIKVRPMASDDLKSSRVKPQNDKIKEMAGSWVASEEMAAKQQTSPTIH